MNPLKPDYYKTLIGSEGLYLEEAYRHRKILRGMEDLFENWGYLPVQTPVFDYYEVYHNLLDQKASSQAYRLFDREGDQLLLRNDITLFLARALGQRMKSLELPLRVFYGDSLLRHEEREGISAQEFFQVGAELLGLEGSEGDLEILALLQEILEYIDLPGTQIHVGSRSLAMDALKDLSPREKSLLLETVEIPDPLGVAGLLKETSLPQEHQDYLYSLLTFCGSLEEGQNLVETGLEKAFLGELGKKGFEEIQSTLGALKNIPSSVSCLLDFSEVGSQAYYTGLVFRAYTPEVGSPIASGGRYDQLLGQFGPPCASVGFSLLTRKIEELAGQQERFSLSPIGEKLRGKDFAQRLKIIQKEKAERKEP